MSSSSSIPDDEFVFYAYDPSIPAAAIFSVIFCLLAIAHVSLTAKWRMTRLLWAFDLGVAMEAAGYIVRILSINRRHGRTHGLPTYTASLLMIILAPALLAASLYMTFGRLINLVGQKYSIIKATRVTATFVTCDIASFVIQALGGAMTTSEKKSTIDKARAILMLGFAIQIGSFGMFLILSFIFRRRAIRDGIPKTGWATMFIQLYVVGLLIMFRTIYRTIEFAEGKGNNSGYLKTHEWPFYVFETMPIVIACTTAAIMHWGRYISNSRFATLDGTSYSPYANGDAENARANHTGPPDGHGRVKPNAGIELREAGRGYPR